MPRKYSVEFKEKAVHQIIEMVRMESCSLERDAPMLCQADLRSSS